jgi:hypothetical protein
VISPALLSSPKFYAVSAHILASFSDLVLNVDMWPLENMAWPSEFWLRMLYLIDTEPRRISRVGLKFTEKGRSQDIQTVQSWQKAFQNLATKGNGDPHLNDL